MDILIATSNRRDIIGLALYSIAIQWRPPRGVYVLDNGEVPIFSNYINRMIWDILERKGIKTHYFRILKEKLGVMEARKQLLNIVSRDEDFMFLDDDSILEPNYLLNISEGIGNYNFAEGLYLLPNNEIQKPDFTLKNYASQELNQYQWAFIEYEKAMKIPVDYGNISGTLFKKKFREILFKETLKYPTNSPMEDFIFTQIVRNGVLITNAIQWHLMNPEQKRDWRYDLENQLRVKFQNKPEDIKKFLQL